MSDEKRARASGSSSSAAAAAASSSASAMETEPEEVLNAFQIYERLSEEKKKQQLLSKSMLAYSETKLPTQIATFRQVELQQKFDRTPDVRPRDVPSSQFDGKMFAEKLRNRHVRLPLFTVAYETELLAEAGAFKRPGSKFGRVVEYPACSQGAKCVGTRFPIQMKGELKGRPMVFMALLFEDEYKALLRDGSLSAMTPRPCLLCHRFFLYDFVIALRHRQLDAQEMTVPETTVRQTHRIRVEEPGGYKNGCIVHPDAGRYEGFVDPFVHFNTAQLRVFRDNNTGRWHVDQSALIWNTPTVPYVVPGESLIAYTTRKAQAVRAAMDISTIQQRCESLALGAYKAYLPRSFRRIMKRVNRRSFDAFARWKEEWIDVCGGVYTRALRDPEVNQVRCAYAVDTVWLETFEVESKMRVLPLSTEAVVDPFAYISRLNIWSSTGRVRQDPLFHLLNKCLPQKCQTRNIGAFVAGFFDKASQSAANRMRCNIVIEWVICTLLGYAGEGHSNVVMLPLESRLKVLHLWHRQGVDEIAKLLVACPLLMLLLLQEFVMFGIRRDVVLKAHLEEVLDWDAYENTAIASGNAARACVASGDFWRNAAEATAVYLTPFKNALTKVAYHRSRKTILDQIMRSSALQSHMMHQSSLTEEQVHFCSSNFLLFSRVAAVKERMRVTIGDAFQPIPGLFDSVIASMIREWCTVSSFSFTFEFTGTVYRLLDVLQHCCNVEDGARDAFFSSEKKISSEKQGDRRALQTIKRVVAQYPRFSLLVRWVLRLIEQMHTTINHELCESVKLQHAKTVAGSHPRVCYLVHCPSCLSVYSLVRRPNQRFKQFYKHGLRSAVVEWMSNVTLCRHQDDKPRHCVCRYTPLQYELLVGHAVYYQSHLYMMCGNPSCGITMEWNAKSCAYANGVYLCSACTETRKKRIIQEIVEEKHSKRCFLCTSEFKTRKQIQKAIALPFGLALCARHGNAKPIKAYYMTRANRQENTTEQQFKTGLLQLIGKLRERRNLLAVKRASIAHRRNRARERERR